MVMGDAPAVGDAILASSQVPYNINRTITSAVWCYCFNLIGASNLCR